jgi:hypothetical protein
MALFEEFCRECEETLPRVGFSDWKTFTKALPEGVQELIDYHTYGKQAQEAKKAVMVSLDNCVCGINNHTTAPNSPLTNGRRVDRHPNFMTWVLPSHKTISDKVRARHHLQHIARNGAGLYKDELHYIDDELYGDMKWYRAMPFYFKSRIEANFEVQVEIKRGKITTITDKNDAVLWDTESDLWCQEEQRERLCYEARVPRNNSSDLPSWRTICEIGDLLIPEICYEFIRRFQR